VSIWFIARFSLTCNLYAHETPGETCIRNKTYDRRFLLNMPWSSDFLLSFISLFMSLLTRKILRETYIWTETYDRGVLLNVKWASGVSVTLEYRKLLNISGKWPVNQTYERDLEKGVSIAREQCYVVCCSVLQCVAVCCSLQYVAVYVWGVHWMYIELSVCVSFLSHFNVLVALFDS